MVGSVEQIDDQLRTLLLRRGTHPLLRAFLIDLANSLFTPGSDGEQLTRYPRGDGFFFEWPAHPLPESAGLSRAGFGRGDFP